MAKYSPILDDRDEYKPGFKFNEWELKGIPIRVEIGPKDIEKEQAVIVRRDNGEKEFVKLSDIDKRIKETLDDIQKSLLDNARKVLEDGLDKATEWKDFEKKLKAKKMVLVPHCMNDACEEELIGSLEGVSARVIPDEQPEIKDCKCIKCGGEAKAWIYFNNGY